MHWKTVHSSSFSFFSFDSLCLSDRCRCSTSIHSRPAAHEEGSSACHTVAHNNSYLTPTSRRLLLCIHRNAIIPIHPSDLPSIFNIYYEFRTSRIPILMEYFTYYLITNILTLKRHQKKYIPTINRELFKIKCTCHKILINSYP